MAAEKAQCSKCQRNISVENEFYLHSGPYSRDGRMPICKKCVEEIYDEIFSACDDMKKSIYFTCMELNVPFKEVFFVQAQTALGKKTERNPFRAYMQFANSNGQRMEGIDTFRSGEHPFPLSNNFTSDVKDEEKDQELVAKWGDGYSQRQLELLDDLYKQYETTNNTNAATVQQGIIIICKLTLKINEALAHDRVDEMKKYSATLKEQMALYDLKPVDQSGDGMAGIKCFSSLTRDVARDGYIPPLPVTTPRDIFDRGLMYIKNHLSKLFSQPTQTEPDFEYDGEDDPDAFAQ